MMLRLIEWRYAFDKWMWVDHSYGWWIVGPILTAYAIFYGVLIVTKYKEDHRK